MHVGVSMTDLLQDADWTDGLSQSYIFLGVLESFGLCHFMFLQSKTIQDNPRQNWLNFWKHWNTHVHARGHARTHTRARARTHIHTHTHARTHVRTHALTRTRVFCLTVFVCVFGFFFFPCSSKIDELFFFFFLQNLSVFIQLDCVLFFFFYPYPFVLRQTGAVDEKKFSFVSRPDGTSTRLTGC